MTIAFRNAVLVSVLLLVVLTAPASAQQGTGVITGRAADSSNAVMPGVTVTLTSPVVMGTREAITDERGGYRFDQLPLGAYALKFELPGFATLIREGIQITGGFTATINVALEVATQSETITVSGQSPVVDTASATVAVNLTPQMLVNLPTARDFISVAGMAPGIMVQKWDVGGSQVGTGTGLRTYGTDGQGYELLDGVIVSEAVYGDFGSLQEVQVVAASKSAEMKIAGSYTNKIVKTGSNDFHGRFDSFWEPPSLQGSNLNDRLRGFGLTTTNRVAKFYDINADIGGPIKKNKLWWYFSARRNWVGLFSPGFKKGGCANVKGCRFEPIGTFVNDNASNEDQVFFTDLPAGTLKLNYQLNLNHSFTYMGNWEDKQQPYRGGSGATAGFLNADAAARQTYPNFINKGQWTWVVNTRITLDTSYNAHLRRWPYYRRVNEYSRRDLDTLQVRGGLSGLGTGFATVGTANIANTQNDYHWQYNIFNLSMMTDHFITGTHNVKIGLSRQGHNGRADYEGTVGQLVLYYRDGFKTPAFIDTFDAPFRYEYHWKSWSTFINDTWKVSPKLTLGLGFRFDQSIPFYPLQEKKGIGPYQSKLVVPARDLPTMYGPVPRFSVIYDVFGDGRTAVKASYGRYVDDPEYNLADNNNPMTMTQSRYTWDATGPAANCYLTTCPFSTAGRTPVSVSGGANRDIDPNIKFSYTDEYTAGLDRELMTDVSLRLFVVRKFEKNVTQNFNEGIPASAYNIPVNGVDPGRDGIAGTADDRTLTVFSLQPAYVGQRRDSLRNNPANDAAATSVNVEVVKRFSKKWQMLTGWDYLFRKTWSGAIPEDPNTLRFNTGQHYNTWHFKASGTYQAPYGISLSGVFRGAKGEAYGRRWNSPRMNQGVQVLTVEPIGTFFMDTVRIVDVRAEKSFTLNERWGKVAFTVDLFNVLNTAAVVGLNNLTGPSFQQPTQTLPPRVAKLAVRYSF